MRAIFIGIKDIIMLIRDKKALFTIIITPLILTFVLGTALGSMWGSGGTTQLGKVLVVNNDPTGELSKILIEEVYGSEEFSTRFTVELIEDMESAKEQVKKGNSQALVIIPKDFSMDLMEGKNSNIGIFGDSGNAFIAPIVLNVTEMFVDEVSMRLVALEVSKGFILEYGEFSEIIDQLFSSLDSKESIIEVVKDKTFANVTIDSNTSAPTAIGYYSAAMAVMYLLFNANLGGKRILKEKEDGTFQRLRVCKASMYEFVLGKTMGIYFSALIQMMVLLLFTRILYNVNWGDLTSVILFSLVVVFAASGFGILIASISTTSKNADSIGSFTILVMSALGGSMWPIYGMPTIMNILSKITFNRWAIEGFNNIMFFDQTIFKLGTHVFTLMAIGVVTMLIATIRLSKMEVK